jgi:hypothetical protein
MVFAMIRIGFKSSLILLGGIGTDQDRWNPGCLGFIDAMNEKDAMFGWIFQRDGALAHTGCPMNP